MHSLGSLEKKAYLYSLIRILAKRHLSHSRNEDTKENGPKSRALNGVIALIAGFVEGIPLQKDTLVDWLAGTSADSIGQSHETRRAVIAAISSDRGAYSTI